MSEARAASNLAWLGYAGYWKGLL